MKNYNPATEEILSKVYDERMRQNDLIRAGKFNWTAAALEFVPCAGEDEMTGPNPYSKLAVLAEEFGEVAHEVCDSLKRPLNKEKLREELIQVAAVAVAWAESL